MHRFVRLQRLVRLAKKALLLSPSATASSVHVRFVLLLTALEHVLVALRVVTVHVALAVHNQVVVGLGLAKPLFISSVEVEVGVVTRHAPRPA